GAAALVLFILLNGSAVPAIAQEADDPPPTEVVVTQEPGACTNHGALCELLLEWTGNERLAEAMAWGLGTPFKIAVIIGLAALCNRLARRGIRRLVERMGTVDLPSALISAQVSERSEQRANAIGSLMRSTATVVIFGIAGIAVLDNIGISIVPLVASLGIAGIAIGFGAQTLVEDLISGVMLIMEDQLGVGDRVDVGVVEGFVERVTLRSTVILAGNGARWYVPNSEIRRVANESQHKAQASVQIGVAYDADLRFVSSVFHQAVLQLAAEPQWKGAGVEDVREPFIAALGEAAIIFELTLFIEATSRRPLERALREQLVDVAKAENIELPNNQLDVWMRTKAS
ncbi:MAG: mechanosensitive ion channel family protein, partial [Acidimicrobiales bacterium]